mmetsp:Transcript_22713/g.33537  ORF Transcript_22713/g.33537 Transcript_22713/m.33537 type:complete len:264 (-) Transcript_22713:1402-2193(-)
MNIASFAQTELKNSLYLSIASSLSSSDAPTLFNLSFNCSTRASKLGVPTKSCKSKRPGLMTAASKARKRFVARKKIESFFFRKSLIAVSIAVVNMRLSIPKPGVSLSRQNSSISSNKITHWFKRCSLSNTYRIRDATLDKPSARKAVVSITTKSQPMRCAKDSQMVVLAVPGGPKRMEEYAAPKPGEPTDPSKGKTKRSFNTDLIVRVPPWAAGLPRSESNRRSHAAGLTPCSENLTPLNSLRTSSFRSSRTVPLRRETNDKT